MMGEYDVLTILKTIQEMYQQKDKELQDAKSEASHFILRARELKDENTQLKARLQLLADNGITYQEGGKNA